ncbi:patatin-like phospholipase family protein [Streptomyces sp. TLI_171]|uniref:patatin-like phospholipase family protein n=1 Tax=Streptomyces sp. TLI_171 TaxID=1938859 RepID=UPI000C19FA53|nr:patatin-like phospholipase family protein [Streptomyces sp. TLI_171]RKE19134.1 NTE family protein [Streptomyces sp. TLI_171]
MRGLVLGGGGLAGIAWQTGLLHGLAETGLDVPGTADHILGTSAGSTVAGQLASGLPLAELYRRQTDPARQNHEIVPPAEALGALFETIEKLLAEITDPAELRRRIGRLALDADTVPAAERHAVIAGRLPAHEWPAWPLTLTAVDADTGEPRTFDRHSGVTLVDAVAASCAVPGIWPPVEIDGRRYMDGGIRSSNNADLMTGQQTVLVLAPMTDPFLAAELQTLEATGRVLAVTPDEDSRAAFGINPLDTAVRTPAAEAGLAQGRRIADQVRELWTD